MNTIPDAHETTLEWRDPKNVPAWVREMGDVPSGEIADDFKTVKFHSAASVVSLGVSQTSAFDYRAVALIRCYPFIQ